MHRQIIYPGAIPLETDLLNTNKYAMIALAKLASAIMGSSTYIRGLACTPTSPASMVVNVSAGEIYSLANIDGTAYSSLAADTTHSILKQGYVLDAQSFTLTAPSTSGYSINYLIQVTYADTDGGSTVLPYYNASNPSTAWSGPNNSGTSQYTVRQGLCTVSLKAGVAATTGTQTTPSPDTGCTGLYVITVAQGATTVIASNIAVYANAPFIPSTGLVDAIQRNALGFGTDTGTANAYVVNLNPGLLSVSVGTEVTFLAANANTGSSTLNVCGFGAASLLNKFGATLIAGEIAANSLVTVEWNGSAWLKLEATGAIPTVPTAAAGTNTTQLATTAFVQTANAGLIGSMLRGRMSVISASSTATFTADEVVVADSLSGRQFRLSSFSATINLATTGAGGMDTGTAPVAGYVAIYAIYNPTTQTTALLAIDASATVATEIYSGTHMPSGYTASALISVWPTRGSQLVVGIQDDRKVSVPGTVIVATSSGATLSTVYVGSFTTGYIAPNAQMIDGNCYILANAGQMAEVSLLAVPAPGTGSRFAVNAIAINDFGVLHQFENSPLYTSQTVLIYAFSTNGVPFNYSITMKGYTF